jgi:hypothetical protein
VSAALMVSSTAVEVERFNGNLPPIRAFDFT